MQTSDLLVHNFFGKTSRCCCLPRWRSTGRGGEYIEALPCSTRSGLAFLEAVRITVIEVLDEGSTLF